MEKYKYAFTGSGIIFNLSDHSEEGIDKARTKARTHLSTLDFESLVGEIERAAGLMKKDFRNIYFPDVENQGLKYGLCPFEYVLIADEVAELLTV